MHQRYFDCSTAVRNPNASGTCRVHCAVLGDDSCCCPSCSSKEEEDVDVVATALSVVVVVVVPFSPFDENGGIIMKSSSTPR